MTRKGLSCTSDRRRSILREVGKEKGKSAFNGIDYIEIDTDQTCISIYFIGPLPAISEENIDIEGGVRKKDIKVEEIKIIEASEDNPEGHIDVYINQPGDFSTYILKLVVKKEGLNGEVIEKPLSGFDPLLSSIEFGFKIGCPTGLDCKPFKVEPVKKFPDPVVSYLAKDYASFRQLIYDRLALILPEWSENRSHHVPDLGVALMELLAYAGDELSYYQDAVATESYLETARQRISVRRHVRLVDYYLHEGCNSRSWVFIDIENDSLGGQASKEDVDNGICLSIPLERIFFISGQIDKRSLMEGLIQEEDLIKFPSNSYKVFRPISLTNDLKPINWGAKGDDCINPFGTSKDGLLTLREAHNRISFYTWGETECSIPAGATSATLQDQERKLALKAGDILIFEEVIGPNTGNPDDADRFKRHAVRLTKVEFGEDEALGMPVLEIWWGHEDALPFPLIISAVVKTKVRDEYNNIRFFANRKREFCIQAGSTSAALSDCEAIDSSPDGSNIKPESKKKLVLKAGDLLVFEGDAGPNAGSMDNIGQSKRHVVRLTRVNLQEDKALGKSVANIEWRKEDAFPFSLCISAIIKKEEECRLIRDISVARGNVVLVDHGDIVEEDSDSIAPKSPDELCEAEGLSADIPNEPSSISPQLKRGPLTFYQPLELNPNTSASAMVIQDPKRALPWIRVGGRRILRKDLVQSNASHTAGKSGNSSGSASKAISNRPKGPMVCRVCQRENWEWAFEPFYRNKREVFSDKCRHNDEYEVSEICSYTRWRPRADLLASHSLDRDFVVELDNFGIGHLRFGDGDLGRMPEIGTELRAIYRVGNGSAGNVGQDMIRGLVISGMALNGIKLKARNPLPASGGMNPENLSDAKLRAPYAFKKDLKRAVTANDYSQLAEKHPAVQKAATAIRWTGSWYEVTVAIDPIGRIKADESLLAEISGYLFPYCRIGHELKVRSADYVPLYLEILVCIYPDHIKGHVLRDLLDILSNRILEDGRKGLFHPDNLTFGESIRLSRIVSAVQAVDGVSSVSILRMHRLEFKDFEAQEQSGEWDEAILTGELKLGPMEIARLDNDPSFPENGQLLLKLEGGR